MPSKTTKTPPPLPSVSIGATDFHRLVKSVMPLADKGDSLPVLSAVWLRGHGEWLTATATDRYRVGVKRVKCEVPEDFEALIPVSALRTLLATFKPSRRNDPTLTLTPEGDRLSVSVEGLVSADMIGGTLSFRLETGEFPKSIERLLAGYASATEPLPEGAAFNPHFLADFKAAAVGPEPIILSATLSASGATTLVVRIGDHFLGALLSRRSSAPDGGSASADWSDIFPPAADKAGAA